MSTFCFPYFGRYKTSPTIWKLSYATFGFRVVVRQVSVCNHCLANSMGPLGWLIQLQRNTIHVLVIYINIDIIRGGPTKRVVFNTSARRKYPSNITGLSTKCQHFAFRTCGRYKSSLLYGNCLTEHLGPGWLLGKSVFATIAWLIRWDLWDDWSNCSGTQYMCLSYT